MGWSGMVLKVGLFLLLTMMASAAFGQTGICTEQAIRKSAQSGDADITNDTFFFSGALDKPIVGKTAAIAMQASPRVTSRTNEQEEERPDRIVVSPTGEMAYEYGTGSVEFDDTKTGKHEHFPIAYLRVWKVENGECKVGAAMFQPEKNVN